MSSMAYQAKSNARSVLLASIIILI